MAHLNQMEDLYETNATTIGLEEENEVRWFMDLKRNPLIARIVRNGSIEENGYVKKESCPECGSKRCIGYFENIVDVAVARRLKANVLMEKNRKFIDVKNNIHVIAADDEKIEEIFCPSASEVYHVLSDEEAARVIKEHNAA